MSAHLDRLLDQLADPSAYPHPADAVTVRQTHISAVFLAGPQRDVAGGAEDETLGGQPPGRGGELLSLRFELRPHSNCAG